MAGLALGKENLESVWAAGMHIGRLARRYSYKVDQFPW